MSVIKNIIQEEYNRLNSLIELYNEKIAEYPRGSLSVKKRGVHAYYYLAYRDHQKVKFLYLGKERSEKVKEYAKKIEQRHKYERMRSKSKTNLNQIKVLLRAAK